MLRANFAALAALTLFPALAGAHAGHGAPGVSHWHATDTGGLLVLAMGVVLLAWFGRSK